jgi:GTP pyrophosphokinase
MHPMHGKLKDYIGTPKENGYRSIHTVVYPLPGISEMPIEIQIRTHQMHRECEFGIASHEEYKTWAYALSSAASRANLFRNLESLYGVAKSHLSFTQALKQSFNEDRLLIFDHENNLYHLPRKATAEDFASQLKQDDGAQIKGVRINGRWQPLHTQLRDGDTVEVVE